MIYYIYIAFIHLYVRKYVCSALSSLHLLTPIHALNNIYAFMYIHMNLYQVLSRMQQDVEVVVGLWRLWSFAFSTAQTLV